MPTYVYKFIDTGETIEVQQAFSDDALTHAKHPATGENLKVKKVFTPVGVTFKGGGFYKTDSRGGKSNVVVDRARTSSESSSSSTSSDSGTQLDHVRHSCVVRLVVDVQEVRHARRHPPRPLPPATDPAGRPIHSAPTSPESFTDWSWEVGCTCSPVFAS